MGRNAALATAWLAVVLILWFGLFVGSMRPGVSAGDALDLYGYFFPKYVYGSGELAAGRLPLWNPYEYGGLPFLGAGQPAVLYPPRVAAFALFGPTGALHALMVGHYLLLGAGAFLMLRVLGLGLAGAAFGTLVIALQPQMLASHYHPLRLAGFTWVPFVVAAFVRCFERPGPAPALALGAAGALQALAGYPEYVLDTAIALVLLAPFAASRSPAAGRGALAVVGGALLALAVSAPQWVALAETYAASARAESRVEFLSGQGFDPASFGPGLEGWVNAVSTFGYLPTLGWIAVCLGLVAPGTPWRWGMLALWVFASAVVSPPLRALPPFNLFRTLLCWTAIIFVPLGALAGRGFERLAAAAAGETLARREVAVGLVATMVALPFCGHRSLGWLALAAGCLLLARAARGRSTPAAIGVALAATLLAILTWVPPTLPGGLRHRYDAGQVPYPGLGYVLERGAEVRAACGPGAGGRVLAPAETLAGVPLAARLAAPQGYPESLPPGRTRRLLEAAGLAPERVLALDWTRLARAGAVLDLLDVTCVVAEPGRAAALQPLGFAPAGRLGDGRVAYARAGSGRAWVAASTRRVADGEEALAAVLDPRFVPVETAIVEEAAGAVCGAERCAPAGRVVSVEARPGRLGIAVEAPAGGLLVVRESHFPGWRARIDGRPTPVVRADYALVAVPLPAGARTVELWYRPRGFAWAVGAALLGVALLAGGGIRCLSRSRSSP